MMRPRLSCADRLDRAVQRGASRLRDDAASEVGEFLQRQSADDGGFRGRGGGSDLYYGFFALAARAALGRRPSGRTVAYLDAFGDGSDLDLVDLCCLARSLARVPDRRDAALAAAGRLDGFRAPGGGYRATRDAFFPSISGTFVARLALEELGLWRADDEGVEDWIEAGLAQDGAWADTGGLAHGATAVTAAVVLMGGTAAAGASGSVTRWLRARRAAEGGFLAAPTAPAPDLLSTAAALLALDALEVPLDDVGAPTVGFVGELWNADGGFRGWAGDTASDSEFTYYALATLGLFAEEPAGDGGRS